MEYVDGARKHWQIWDSEDQREAQKKGKEKINMLNMPLSLSVGATHHISLNLIKFSYIICRSNFTLFHLHLMTCTYSYTAEQPITSIVIYYISWVFKR